MHFFMCGSQHPTPQHNTTHQAATTHSHTLTHTHTYTYTLTRSSLHLSHNSQPPTQNVKFRASLDWSHLPAGVVPDSNSFHQCFRRGPDGGALLPHLHGDCHHSSRRYVHPFSRPPCQCQLVRIAIFKQLMEFIHVAGRICCPTQLSNPYNHLAIHAGFIMNLRKSKRKKRRILVVARVFKTEKRWSVIDSDIDVRYLKILLSYMYIHVDNQS